MPIFIKRRSLGLFATAMAAAASPVPPVSVSRGFLSDPALLELLQTDDSGTNNNDDDCHFELNEPIVISHPQSLDKDDRYYVLGSTSYEAVVMTVDYINQQRCGVHIQGKKYPIVLQTLGDHSDPAKHAAIGKYLVNRTDFMLAGYSSLLTQHLAPIAQDNKRLMVAGGSSRSSIYADRPYAFGILPPGHLYLEQALKGVATHGARTVASIAEDGLEFICDGIPDLTAAYGLQLITTTGVSADPGFDELLGVADDMASYNPDVVVTCTFDGGCARWIEAMRKRNWSPKAQIFTLCIGLNELEQQAGLDAAYMMGASSWDKNLPPIPDAVTSWTPGDFASHFERYAFKNATYQSTAAATALSVLVQAIELADSLDTDLVREQLVTHTFDTMYGDTSFNEDGQNQVPNNLFQYDGDMNLHVVYPLEKSSNTFSMVYPMPTFANRDCVRLSSCQSNGGMCRSDGSCDCSALEHDVFESGEHQYDRLVVSLGNGAEASCKVVPHEDYSFMSGSWKLVGYALVAFQGFLSFIAIVWTIKYRFKPIVQASQPFFLIFIAAGCFIMVASILPASVEAEYRFTKDPFTGRLTDEVNPDVHVADISCMEVPWLAGLGFAVVFSSLFAKIRRIKKMLDNAAGLNRKPVDVKDVISVMIVMISIETAILLSWQITDPLKWDRDVLLEDSDGFALQSVGKCYSGSAIAFVAPLAVVNVFCLGYALWLCYLTRFVSSDFAEGKWIAICVVSILQILLLAIPVLVIAEDDPTSSYFVRAGVVWLIGTMVTLLIFVPKMARMAFSQQTDHQSMKVRFNESVAAHAAASGGSDRRASSQGSRERMGNNSSVLLNEPSESALPLSRTSVGWGRTTIASLVSDCTDEHPDHRDTKHGKVRPDKAVQFSDAQLSQEGTSNKKLDPESIGKIRQKRREAWGLSNFQSPEEERVGNPRDKEVLPDTDISASSPYDSSESEKGNTKMPPMGKESRRPRRDTGHEEPRTVTFTNDTEESNTKHTVELLRRARIQQAVASVSYKKH
eukprot:scaffold1555_cov173-Amphora_coffeaeformis.AAC.3